jgi:hypothetical protein
LQVTTPVCECRWVSLSVPLHLLQPCTPPSSATRLTPAHTWLSSMSQYRRLAPPVTLARLQAVDQRAGCRVLLPVAHLPHACRDCCREGPGHGSRLVHAWRVHPSQAFVLLGLQPPQQSTASWARLTWRTATLTGEQVAAAPAWLGGTCACLCGVADSRWLPCALCTCGCMPSACCVVGSGGVA